MRRDQTIPQTKLTRLAASVLIAFAFFSMTSLLGTVFAAGPGTLCGSVCGTGGYGTCTVGTLRCEFSYPTCSGIGYTCTNLPTATTSVSPPGGIINPTSVTLSVVCSSTACENQPGFANAQAIAVVPSGTACPTYTTLPASLPTCTWADLSTTPTFPCGATATSQATNPVSLSILETMYSSVAGSYNVCGYETSTDSVTPTGAYDVNTGKATLTFNPAASTSTTTTGISTTSTTSTTTIPIQAPTASVSLNPSTVQTPGSLSITVSCSSSDCNSNPYSQSQTVVIYPSSTQCPATIPNGYYSCGSWQAFSAQALPCGWAATSQASGPVSNTFAVAQVSTDTSGIYNVCGYETYSGSSGSGGVATASAQLTILAGAQQSIDAYINSNLVANGGSASTSSGTPVAVSFSVTCPVTDSCTQTDITLGSGSCAVPPPSYNACSSSQGPPCTITTGTYTFSATGAYPVCFYGLEASGWVPSSATLNINTGGGGGGGGSGGGATSSSALGAICNVYYVVNTVVFLLALTLMILGGALYAGAQILPGSARGQVQGYAMGMVMGGLAGAVIAVLAPYILSIVYNAPINTIAICTPS